MNNILNFFLLFVCLHTAHCFSFVKHFKVCHRNDPDLDKCLQGAIETGFKLLGPSGLPAINVPTIDPLKVSKIIIGEGTKAVNLVQKYYDASIIGLSKLKVKKAHFDFDKNILSFTSTHDVLKMEAKYDINGKILILPVYGNGDSFIIFGDVVITHSLDFEEETKNDKKYLKVKDYTATLLSVGKAHFDFKNLFDGDRRLGDNILKVVNDNWKVIYEDVKEGIEKSFSKVFLAIARTFFSQIPLDDMLPK